MPRKTPEQIRFARSVTLEAAWIKIREEFKDLGFVPTLNSVAVRKITEDYIATREAFSKRYKITDRIQRPKIAGFMAASILRYKPVAINDQDHSPAHGYGSTQANEMLAFWHGLAICAEGAPEEDIHRLISSPVFETWYNDILWLFEHNTVCSEALVMIFETLSLLFFTDNLKRHTEVVDIKSSHSRKHQK
jgi:hypothetical protein